MSVVINTNYAATIAANNLAASSATLQRSLNRLSSGSKIVSPQDDAAGLAVSMKLSSTARRQSAASANIGNAVSFLQTQDGALQAAGKILSRVGELKTLYADPTKNADDLANYQAEFEQLQLQLTSLAGERFNGQALFNSADREITTTSDGGTVTIASVGLLSSGADVALSYTDGVSGGADFQAFTPATAGTLTVTSGGLYIENGSNSVWLDQVGDTATYDGAGGWTFSGAGVNGLTGSFASGASTVTIEGSMNTSWLGAATFSSSRTRTGEVADASDLGALALNTITDAISEISTRRSTNGAQQTRLQFADEVLQVNRANIQAANSRISDVDVAEESTTLARYNILVQSGTAMLTQANQSAQMALRLLG
jgi:flagellin